jgi:hypothetical protein
VLDNDTVDGENAGEAGATATLVNSVSHGTLECAGTALELCEDGSFTYTPDGSFTGLDSFTYEAAFGGATARATVTLTACAGGPDLNTCWQESAYTAKLTELGFGSFQEGFEDAAWEAVREPDSAPSVTAQGIRWASNYPATNEITTGNGPARTGVYGLYDPDHGFATGTAQECDIDNPPAHCLFHDGWTGTRTSGGAFQGAGGYFTGTSGANIAVLLDGGAQIGLGRLPDPGHHFLGVIRTTAFSTFQFREMDGKVGQARFIFADDFTFGTGDAPINQAPTADAGPDQRALVGNMVILDGRGSDDADGDPLNYSWSFVSRPANSTATLNTANPVRPTFVADQPGSYTVQLIVDDGIANSDPDTVRVTATDAVNSTAHITILLLNN